MNALQPLCQLADFSKGERRQIGKYSPSPILVTDCAKVIRAAHGSIWLVEKQDFGTQVRATINTQNIRVVVMSISRPQSPIPDELNSLLHVVKNIEELREWLQNFGGSTGHKYPK